MEIFEQDRSAVRWIKEIRPDWHFPYATVYKVFAFTCKNDVKVNENLIKSYTKEAGAKECFFNVDSFEWLERYLIGLLGIKSVNTWDTVKVFDKKTFYGIYVVECTKMRSAI